MAHFNLEGETLAEKHRSYNKTFNELLSSNLNENLPAINYDDCDIDNLLKIDIACRQRNVDYILEVFKSKDMLYVSRAIKQTTWLITESQYAHIINPQFLHQELLPSMSTKAYNKLMLHIRLNLRDEDSVDQFYCYYEDIDLKKAFKWLPHSSPTLIQKVLKQHGKDIPMSVMKRLNYKSDYLYTFCKDVLNFDYYHDVEIAQTILRADNKNFVNFLKLVGEYNIQKLSASKTKKIMKKCPEEIKNNIDKYINKVHMRTFAKHIPPKDMKDYLTKNCQNPYLKSLFQYKNLKHFIKYLPDNDKYDLINTVFINKKEMTYTLENDLYNNTMIRCLTNMNNDYLWYEFMPFDVAFVDLKRLIETESSPVKKTNMLCVLLSCAHGNEKHIEEVLKYYHANHINEAYKYKTKFVKHLLEKEDVYHIGGTSWNLLNNLFYCMGIYTQSNKNNVDEYVDCVILYNIIHHYNVPDIIISKFNFKTFKSIQKVLTEEENLRLFKFLMEFSVNILQQNNISEENNFDVLLSCLQNISDLCCDFKQNITDSSKALNKINEIIIFLVSQSRFEDLKKINDIGKCYKRLIIHKSILITPTDNECMNALKYRPLILQDQMEIICKNSEFRRRRFLQKLRIYWHDTLASYFKDTYWKLLSENVENVNVLRNILILLSDDETTKLLQKYIGTGYKLHDTQNNTKLWRGIANNLYLSRPQPSFGEMLPYTSNVTYPHISSALNVMLLNINYFEMRLYISRFSDFITPLKKLVLKFASFKLKHDEVIKLFNEVWFTTKNNSMRLLIFKLTFSLMCSSKCYIIIKDVWALLERLIDDLGVNEHKLIYETLCNIQKCPTIIRKCYYNKVKTFLMTVPDGNYYKKFDSQISVHNPDMNETLDIDVVLTKANKDLQDLRTKRCYAYWLPEYLLNTKSEKSQMERYHAILLPLLENALSMWDKPWQGAPAKANFISIKERLYNFIGNDLLHKELVVPIAMFTDIYKRIEKALPNDENYLLLKSTKLAIGYLKTLDMCKKTYSIPNNSILSKKICEEFGTVCSQELNEDVKKYSPSIYFLFSQTLDHLFRKLDLDVTNQLDIFEGIIRCNPTTECFLLVIELLPRRVFSVDEYNLRRDLMHKLKLHPDDAVQMHLHNYFLRI